MSNLIRCLRCKQSLIKEEWDDHVCSRHFKGVRNIEVLQWWQTTNEKGEHVAFGIGSDGYTYKLTEINQGFMEVDFTNQLPNLNKKNFDDETPTGEQKLIDLKSEGI